MSQKFRQKKLDETRKYFLDEIKQNELMSLKHRKVYTTLKKLMIKILNSKLKILLEYQNIKTFLHKAMVWIGLNWS